jgi:hypothetical protein
MEWTFWTSGIPGKQLSCRLNIEIVKLLGDTELI